MARLAVSLSTLMVLLVALTTLGESSPARFCCTDYTESPVPMKKLKEYRIQKDTEGCNLRAVLFTTVRKRLVCAHPDKKWVQEGVDYILQNKRKAATNQP